MNVVQLPNRVFKAKEEREKNEYVNYIRDVVFANCTKGEIEKFNEVLMSRKENLIKRQLSLLFFNSIVRSSLKEALYVTLDVEEVFLLNQKQSEKLLDFKIRKEREEVKDYFTVLETKIINEVDDETKIHLAENYNSEEFRIFIYKFLYQ
ncbi:MULTISPECIES: hypothetical protein [Bacillus cereus group]|uniref:Uncharacterized protein n=1 Tax=Bacillus anthracis TaxID=1392 RepID=A0A0J1HKG3_BACAN|nr:MULTISPECIES: hypothetical protein [Bacillus cereus group]OUA67956.1 hypothetical protein BK786_08515 [Bacillus thuringiensis serovar thailandensis]KLV14243.1 hypothetical protein ABW01_27980 [Bacillus anthracis]MCU5202639.1 hypothetical protein [Bacillus paranthracis]OPA00136.1 hypothetical protein BHL51_12355 [Bacillus cereus]RXG06389.1 hypothetical protein EO768_24290 [Bacillus cereus]